LHIGFGGYYNGNGNYHTFSFIVFSVSEDTLTFHNNHCEIKQTSDGLLIFQNEKTYLARKWQLSTEVKLILEHSIASGFDKLWVAGHPKGSSAHYLCFSRSHHPPWEYLIGAEGLKKTNGTTIPTCITVNACHRKTLEHSDVDFHWQNFGGKHVFVEPSLKNLQRLINTLQTVDHSLLSGAKARSTRNTNKISKTGFQLEKELEDYLFGVMQSVGHTVVRQPKKFQSNTQIERDSIPDLICLIEGGIWIGELKLNSAHIADLHQTERYIRNNEILANYQPTEVQATLVAAHFDEHVIKEAQTKFPHIELCEYGYDAGGRPTFQSLNSRNYIQKLLK
jgi:hypothetical protein